MEVYLLEQKDVTTEFQEQFHRLYAQLISSRAPKSLHELFDTKNDLSLVYCKENDQIIGMASMATYSVLSGFKGWIEDVVVDEKARGKGIGRLLIQRLIEIAKEKELSQILLFTERHREAAIHLYADLGFKFKDSQIYQLKLKP